MTGSARSGVTRQRVPQSSSRGAGDHRHHAVRANQVWSWDIAYLPTLMSATTTWTLTAGMKCYLCPRNGPEREWLAALDDFRNWLIREAA